MENDFDRWNQQKQLLEIQPQAPFPFPKVREVWMIAMGRNLGFEQNGVGGAFERPVLVITKFNNQMFWAVPLSTKQKRFDFYYNFTDPFGNAAALILAQMRLVSVKRFERKLYLLPENIFGSARKALVEMLKSKPRTRRGFSEPFGTL